MPGLTHFSYPARDEEWHQELPVSQAGPRANAAAPAGPAGAQRSASHPAQWRCWRKLSSATSKALTLLSVVHWEVSEARSVVFISPVLASGFIWQWKGVAGWKKKEMCATRLSLSLPRERASQFIHNIGAFCHLAAFAQHPTVQGHVPGVKQPLAVLLPWWSKISMLLQEYKRAKYTDAKISNCVLTKKKTVKEKEA